MSGTQLPQGLRENAIFVPQRAVLRESNGSPYVYVVQDGKIAIKKIKTIKTEGTDWLLESGLEPGDKVVIEGLQRIRPGVPAQHRPDYGRTGSSAAEEVTAGSKMAKFFINRPIFAWVIAIVIMLAGTLSILNLPVSMYPQIAPPQVSISATYPGASAKTIEDTVVQIIEQKMTGLDGYLYMSSTSESSGRINITLTFAAGTNPDMAQVQVQNRLARSVFASGSGPETRYYRYQDDRELPEGRRSDV